MPPPAITSVVRGCSGEDGASVEDFDPNWGQVVAPVGSAAALKWLSAHSQMARNFWRTNAWVGGWLALDESGKRDCDMRREVAVNINGKGQAP